MLPLLSQCTKRVLGQGRFSFPCPAAKGIGPESSHAIRAAIDEALHCKETGEEKTIVFGLTGTGYFDMVAYEKFHDGQMTDFIPTDADLQKGFDGIPKFSGNEI